MAVTKKEFKFFTIVEYQKEEKYLSEMHKNGWKLTKVSGLGHYHFEKCTPEKVSYRLDYNQEGLASKDEYVQMFSDCGWEYLFDYVGYSYFRKPVDGVENDEEIFCDEESRFEMMRRVFKGRVTPLIAIFAGIILPQLALNASRHGDRDFYNMLAIVFSGLAILYLSLFGIFARQFYQYEKMLNEGDSEFKKKYVAIVALIIALLLLVFYTISNIFF